MNASREEDQSPHHFVSRLRQSVKQIQEGQAPVIKKLTPDRTTALEEIELDSRPKRGYTSISSILSTSFNSPKQQRVEERLDRKLEKISIRRKLTAAHENEETEEIESDIIPNVLTVFNIVFDIPGMRGWFWC